MNADEFYIGWESKAPAATAAFVKKVVLVVVFAIALLAVVISLTQQTISNGVFEWGHVKQFTGTFVATPYPHLVSQTNTYYLVASFKHGVEPKLARELNNKSVILQGTLIYRDNQRMIEVLPESIQTIPSSKSRSLTSTPLGRQTLTGEIVDSKCYFGVMNPGQFIPHRACAIHCISGGVPPVLVVRRSNAETSCLLLTAADGRPVNKEILRVIAEPVRITGIVEQTDGLLTLRAESIKRL